MMSGEPFTALPGPLSLGRCGRSCMLVQLQSMAVGVANDQALNRCHGCPAQLYNPCRNYSRTFFVELLRNIGQVIDLKIGVPKDQIVWFASTGK